MIFALVQINQQAHSCFFASFRLAHHQLILGQVCMLRAMDWLV